MRTASNVQVSASSVLTSLRPSDDIICGVLALGQAALEAVDA